MKTVHWLAGTVDVVLLMAARARSAQNPRIAGCPVEGIRLAPERPEHAAGECVAAQRAKRQ